MSNEDSNIKAKYDKYLYDWAESALGIGSLVVIFLIPLDYLATPSNFKTFLVYRIVTSLSLLILYALNRRKINEIYQSTIAIIGGIIVAGMVAMMIYSFQGHRSPYFAGMILVAIFFGFLPLKFRESLIVSLVIYLIYLLPILIYDTITDKSFFISANVLMIFCFSTLLVLQYLAQKRLMKGFALQYQVERSERWLAESQKVAKIGSWSWDIPNNSLAWSKEAFKRFDKDPDTFIPTTEYFWRLIHPDDKEALQRATKETLNNNKPYHVETRVINESGREWVLEGFGVVERDAEGKPLRFAGTVQDITERKRAEEALQLTRFTVDSAADAVYWLDSKARIVDVNETACKMLGYSREELLGLTVLDIDPGFTADRWTAAWESVRRKGKLTLETIHRTKNGQIIPVEIMAHYLTFGGKEIDCAFARDISQRKVVEGELLKTQRLESLGIFAGGIAHDFNNLLQAIMGNVSLAKVLTNPEERVFPLLEEAEKASEQAKELSCRLLTFSKGGEPVRRATFVEKILKESISLSLSGSSVGCELSLPKDLDLVEVDRGQMNQVFNNLLINAKEAMPDGGSVEVSASNVRITGDDNLPLKGGRYVKISVADHGAGIPEKYLPRIFDPYFSTKDRGSDKGMGLGLAICHSIMSKHEGHIGVESREGAGTVFHIYLPAAEGRDEERPGKESHFAAGRGRVLFMDDDEGVRKIAGAMLKQLGYEVEFAKNGEEAADAYRRAKKGGRTFDAAILDLTVQGGMGGEKALRRLREIDPEVKAVVSSGYAEDPVMKDFGRYGFADAIAKPYNAKELKGLLSKLQV